MELDLKAKEYKKLCDKLKKLRENNIDENVLDLKEMFQKNHDEIADLNKQIEELEKHQKLVEKQAFEKYDSTNLFNNRKKLIQTQIMKG